ncbi:unnamed protein product [Calypogeia fissa]
MALASLATKTVLVTGAAGGLGKAIANACLEAGANVVACDINETLLKECEAELSPKGPFMALKADVADEDAAAKAIEGAIQKFSRLDVLVNNAGIMDKFDPADTLEMGLWQRVLAVNLTGPYIMSRLALRHFLAQSPPSGNIVNIGSGAALRGAAAGAAYTASKHGLVGLTRNTAASYMKQGIRCNIVLPGGMHTNIVAQAMAPGFSPSGLQNAMMANAMEPQFADVNDVAKTVVHLASDASLCLNGSIITTDHGWNAF